MVEIRKSTHAGSWYPRYEPDLINMMNGLFTNKQFGPGSKPSVGNKERTIIGGLAPHAGYAYSGSCAAHTYYNLFKETIPDTIIIFGTDHQGYGNFALMREGIWETPLGNLNVDSQLAEHILQNSEKIIEDNSAFIGFPNENEHNIEIQLPFIKYCSQEKDVKILPIKLAVIKDFKLMNEIAEGISKSISETDKEVILVASSDLSHKNVSDEAELKKFKSYDQEIAENFEALDPKKTLKACLNTTVCGPQTITTLLLTCQKMGAKQGKILKYYTSHDITDKTSGYCVGYLSAILSK
ncbi:MAG: hypothetical protein BAJALOKI1v1_370017 [Promethearchaeota archaeon]|nr:MAG: hypothetical protein BAJALOKI1v1_370017 [Candidatus Lokiarchaeota archaeon]